MKSFDILRDAQTMGHFCTLFVCTIEGDCIHALFSDWAPRIEGEIEMISNDGDRFLIPCWPDLQHKESYTFLYKSTHEILGA